MIKFIIVVVCYNAQDRLKQTLDNIYSQEYWNFNVIIKDGDSIDGSLEALQSAGYFSGRIADCTEIIVGPDKGIYDAMNIAVSRIEDSNPNNYVIFMNCGDSFYDRQTLGHVADFIEKYHEEKVDSKADLELDECEIFYGNQFNLTTNTCVTSSPKLNEFSLYRNVPCHQVCFYDSRLFIDRAYDTKYKVRADYEHFLYCVYEKNAKTIYLDGILSKYEGGGFSETKENREISASEHREITDRYMGNRAKKYRAVMTLSGAGLRTRMAESKSLSGIYNGAKSFVYKIKAKK